MAEALTILAIILNLGVGLVGQTLDTPARFITLFNLLTAGFLSGMLVNS